MKIKSILLFLVLFNTKVSAQKSVPQMIGIMMVGKSSKPILDIYIVDSISKIKYKYDEHTIVLDADTNTLTKIFASFKNERKYDSLTKYDYSFGTFLFVFRFENNKKVKVMANRIQSIQLFKKVIETLSPENDKEGLIIKEMKNTLERIDY